MGSANSLTGLPRGLWVGIINSKSYWDGRFSSGDWVNKGGRSQTENFAREQIRYFSISYSFEGRIVDFGCGLGDAIPVYRRRFPRAKLIGVDFSFSAIRDCKSRYGHLADFICGEAGSVPVSDVIIASNVLEHIEDDESIVYTLLAKCSLLYIIVPYKEILGGFDEHINTYDKNSFKKFADSITSIRVFPAKGWSQYGKSLFFDVYAKNLLRPFFGKHRVHRRKQIIFQINGLYCEVT